MVIGLKIIVKWGGGGGCPVVRRGGRESKSDKIGRLQSNLLFIYGIASLLRVISGY